MTYTGPAQSASELFSAIEIQDLHRDDRSAAAAVIALMTGIFSIGLVGYSAVCLWVING